MALAVTMHYDFRDEKGKTSFTEIKVPTGFSIAQLTEFAAASAQVLINASHVACTGVSINIAIDISASLTNVVTVGANVAKKAFFQFQSAIGGLIAKFKIPTLDESNVVAGTDQLDIVAAPVAAYIAAIEDGLDIGAGVFIQPTDKRGNDLTTLDFARELHQRRRG
jgi:hypothetical protein